MKEKVEIFSRGEPRVTEMPCSCGGTLVYGPLSPDAGGALHVRWNKQEIEVSNLWGYKCTNSPNCPVQLLLSEVADKLRQGIQEAKKMTRLEKQPSYTIIEGIESGFDLSSRILCCGQPTVQKQINYRIICQ